MLRYSPMLFLAVWPLACHDPRPADLVPDDGAEVPILRQYSVADSREQRRMQLVVRDAESWARLPLIDAPIDFDKETALVVTLGRMLSNRYAVRITRVWRDGRSLRVAVAIDQPPAEAPLALAGPFCVAIIPRCDMPVEGFSADPPKAVRTRQSAPVRRREKVPRAPQ